LKNYEDAIERIKVLECPTGDLESRVAGILESHEIGNRNEIMIRRDERYDRDEAWGYSAKVLSDNSQTIVILAKSGLDDYVAKVVDVYIN